VKCAVIAANTDEHSISLMCRVLEISRSGFHAWYRRMPSARAQRRSELDIQVQDAFMLAKRREGAQRLSRKLSRGRRQVAESLRRQGLRAKAARRYKATTNSRHNLPVAENLLNQNFRTERPNQAWVSDITYIQTDEGWMYLAVVLDLYSRKVVGWAMDSRMTAALVCDALLMSLFRRKFPRGVIIHSDRGSQYCSKEHRSLLENYDLVPSMSAKGNCYDNAAMESWNHSLKVEAIHGERFATREQAKTEVFEYIEVYYNRSRLHSTLGYVSPDQFELQNIA